MMLLLLQGVFLYFHLNMLFRSHPFSQPFPDGFQDDGEIAVSQIQEEFFQRTAYLNPRMAPAINFVETFLILNIFQDITGMLERELQFMALHHENPAISLRRCLHATRKMGRLIRQAKIINQILCRHNRHTRTQQHGRPEQTFKILLA